MDSLCHPCITTTHLSYSFLSLKLPPPPCAVLLVTTETSWEGSLTSQAVLRTLASQPAIGQCQKHGETRGYKRSIHGVSHGMAMKVAMTVAMKFPKPVTWGSTSVKDKLTRVSPRNSWIAPCAWWSSKIASSFTTDPWHMAGTWQAHGRHMAGTSSHILAHGVSCLVVA